MSRKRTNALSREESVLPYKYQLNTDSHLPFGEYSPLLFDSLVVVGSSELQKYWLWTHTLGRLVMYSLMDLFLHIISPLTGPQRYSRSQKSCQTLWISLRTTKLYYPCLGSEGFEASFTTSVLSGTIHTYHLTFSLLITFYIINFLMNISVGTSECKYHLRLAGFYRMMWKKGIKQREAPSDWKSKFTSTEMEYRRETGISI